MVCKEVLLAACIVYVAFARPQFVSNQGSFLSNQRPLTEEERLALEELERDRNAHYAFSQAVDDKISDLEHTREEVREGLTVKGSYKYSDGNLRRTVHYVADQGGFRIVSDVAEPLSGPNVNPAGTASVAANVANSPFRYSIQAVPVDTTEFLQPHH